jgi:16S rRNA (adenine1518-N6/adenine1519-N6)-dimethyltransferase
MSQTPGHRGDRPQAPSSKKAPTASTTQDLSPRRLLQAYGIRPRKGLGQHFLASSEPLQAIVEAADLGPDDVVLEVGPGLGVLTHALSHGAGQVIAVEIDPTMRKVLADQLGHRENLRVVDADILRADPSELLGLPPEAEGRIKGYKVVANLPYQITSAALRHLLDAKVRPEKLVVMVQKEVADRILADDGKQSILAVALRYYAQPSRVVEVPRDCFHPPPRVDSSVVMLDLMERPAVDVEAQRFFKVVRAGFSLKRKQLKNSLANGMQIEAAQAVAVLEAADIDPRRRAETLSLDEWAAICHQLEATAIQNQDGAAGS